MDEEEIKKKKLEARKAEEQLKTTLRLVLEEPAYDRMMNVSLANKEFYLEAAKQLLMAAKRIGRKIKEAEVIAVLKALKERSETKTTITFRSK